MTGEAIYRPPAVEPADRLVWPAGFGQRYALFVDVEEEFDWSAPFGREQRSVSASAALPAACDRLVTCGAAPVLLVDHPIATDPAAIDAVRTALTIPDVAVGTQLHPWVNPPFDEAVSPRNSFVGNLPPALEAAKIDALTTAIEAAFDVQPRIYRAGRYGLGPHSLTLLARAGYRIDSSMRSAYDYSGSGGPDYRSIDNRAFRVGGIVELPLTTIFTGRLWAAGMRLHDAASRFPRGVGVLARSGLLNRVALTPEDMPLREVLEAIRMAAGEGLALMNFSFHSPSLEPGHTPYVRDAADLSAFWAWWDGVFALLDRLGIRAASEADLLEAIGQA